MDQGKWEASDTSRYNTATSLRDFKSDIQVGRFRGETLTRSVDMETKGISRSKKTGENFHIVVTCHSVHKTIEPLLLPYNQRL